MNVGVNKINVYKNTFPSGGELDDSWQHVLYENLELS